MTEPKPKRPRNRNTNTPRCPLCKHTLKAHTQRGQGCAYCKCRYLVV